MQHRLYDMQQSEKTTNYMFVPNATSTDLFVKANFSSSRQAALEQLCRHHLHQYKFTFLKQGKIVAN